MATREELENIVKAADRAYSEAKGTDEERKAKYWEAVRLIEPYEEELITAGLGGPALRRKGWALYYLGNLANPRWREGIIKNLLLYAEATTAWEKGLSLTSDPKIRNSILNGLPLSLRWLGEESEKYPTNWWELSPEERKKLRRRAYQYSRQGMDEAKASGDAELLRLAQNTKTILLREEKSREALEEAIEECRSIFEFAITNSNWQLAGMAKQNEGDALRMMMEIRKDPVEKKIFQLDAIIAYRTGQAFCALMEKEFPEQVIAHHYGGAKAKADEELAKL